MARHGIGNVVPTLSLMSAFDPKQTLAPGLKVLLVARTPGRHALLARTSYWSWIRQILLKIGEYDRKGDNWITLAKERPAEDGKR